MGDRVLRTPDGNLVRCLHIRNVPKNATEADLINVLKSFGTIMRLILKKVGPMFQQRSTYAFVTFATSEQAFLLYSNRRLKMFGQKLYVGVADIWHQPITNPDGSINYHPPKKDFRFPVVTDMVCTPCETEQPEEEEKCDDVHVPVVIQDSPITQLNDDCLLHILEFIPFPQRYVFSHVCRRWRILMESYWSKFTCLNYSAEPFNSFTFSNSNLGRYLRLCPNIRSVHLETSDILSIMINSENNPNSTSITMTAELCPKLEELVLSDIDLIGRPLAYIAHTCTKLNSLTLKSCNFRKTDSQLNAIMQRCVFLKTLKLMNCDIKPGDWLKNLPIGLKSLSLISCSISNFNNFLAGLGRLERSLEELVLILGFLSKPLNFIELSDFTKLERVVYMNRSLQSQMTSVDMFRNLKSLELEHCGFLSDAILQGLVTYSPDLNVFNIASIKEDTVSSEGYKALGDLKELTTLNLGHNFLEDDALIVIAEKSKNLEVLILYGCQNISNVGCESVVQNLMKLKELYVESCKKVTNKTIDAAVKAAIQSPDKVKLTIYAAESGVTEVQSKSHAMVEVMLEKKGDLNDCIIYTEPNNLHIANSFHFLHDFGDEIDYDIEIFHENDSSDYDGYYSGFSYDGDDIMY